MDILNALKKGRTVQELMTLTKLSRGGVIQALRRSKRLIKKVGSKREHERGPESTIYQLRSGVKPNAVKKPAKKRKGGFKAILGAMPDLKGEVPPETLVTTPATEAQTTLAEAAPTIFSSEPIVPITPEKVVAAIDSALDSLPPNDYAESVEDPKLTELAWLLDR